MRGKQRRSAGRSLAPPGDIGRRTRWLCLCALEKANGSTVWHGTQDGNTEAQTLDSPLTGFRRELTFENAALFLPAKESCGQGPEALPSLLNLPIHESENVFANFLC